MVQHRSGSVRSAEARAAILDAVARQFSERGYDHLTIEGVAADAGVGKQTIYRWWSSRAALVAECLLEGMLLPERLSPPAGGDIRSDLTRWLEQIFSLADAPEGQGLLRSLIAASVDDEAVGRRLHDSLAAGEPVRERLQLAVDAGELAADLPLEQVGEALVGAAILRALSGKPATPEVIDGMIRVALGDPRTGDRKR